MSFLILQTIVVCFTKTCRIGNLPMQVVLRMGTLEKLNHCVRCCKSLSRNLKAVFNNLNKVYKCKIISN
jgi:hypothetical protein